MKILMTGATGWLGRSLGMDLVKRGHRIVALVRDPQKAAMHCPFPAQWVRWDYAQGQEVDGELLQNVDAIVHLMGEPVAGTRWTEAVKNEISRSRVLSTQHLAALAKKHAIQNFVSASAVGYYGERGNEELTEISESGEGFLAQVCKDWEGELFKHETSFRCVALRIGVVLGRGGGALEKMLPVFRYGSGGKLGSGKQWMPWIHIDDLKNMFVSALENRNMQGVYNATAPEPVQQKEFAQSLALALHRPAFLPAPSMALQCALGEMSSVVLSSAKVLPKRFQDMGHVFKYADLKTALGDLLGGLKAGEVEFVSQQFIPQKKEEVFPFFSDEHNLEKLTPPFLNFKVLGKSAPQIEENCLIDYRLSLNGIPFKWRTQILHWQPPHQFVDTQLSGPYRKWYHTHTFEDLENGTLMTDRVVYALPFGFLGYLAAHWKVAGDVNAIFGYRRKVIFSMFYA